MRCVLCCELWSWVPRVRRMWQVRILFSGQVCRVEQRPVLTFWWHWHDFDLPIGWWS